MDRMTSLATAGLLCVGGGLATRYGGLGIPLYSYGIFIGLGFVAGFALATLSADRMGLPKPSSRATLLVGVVIGLVSARALFVAGHWELFQGARWGALAGLDRDAGLGGLSAFGGLFLGTVAAAVTARFARGQFWAIGDAAAPALSLSLVLCRLGSFCFGSDYGKPVPADFPLGVQFPGSSVDACRGSPAFEHHCACLTGRASEQVDCSAISGSLVQADGSFASLPVHPTQLYEVGVGLVLLLLTWAALRRRLFRGQALLTFFLFYAVARYLVEMVKDDLHRLTYGPFTSAQVLALLIVPLGLGLAVYLYRTQRLEEPADPGTGHQG